MGVDNTANCASGHGHTVCVTGAAGFIASWLVKLLLEKGYIVRGTVRNPDDDVKNAHLRALDGAAERLMLVQADLLDKASLDAAFQGCEGVFHTASPVTDGPGHILVEILEITTERTGKRGCCTSMPDFGGVSIGGVREAWVAGKS